MGMRVRGKATARPDQSETPPSHGNGWFGVEDRNASSPIPKNCTWHAKPERPRKNCRCPSR
jgi:hypothetical protein